MNTAVFVSGNGTNLQALLDAENNGRLGGARIRLVVCDKPGAYALERAAGAGVEVYLQEAEGYASREEYDRDVIRKLKEKDIGLVVLAGFMRILSGEFVDEYESRALNIHPALLPAFKGEHGIKDAFDHGVKVTGVTVHFVDKVLDGGPIVLQRCVAVDPGDTLDSLEEKIHELEHELYPEAVRLFAEGRLRVNGRKVEITP